MSIHYASADTKSQGSVTPQSSLKGFARGGLDPCVSPSWSVCPRSFMHVARTHTPTPTPEYNVIYHYQLGETEGLATLLAISQELCCS